MDKIERYHDIICEILGDYASIKKSLTPDIKSQMLVDEQNRHYQLLSLGWHNGRYVCNITFHFDIIGGKVWVQQNNTDVLIADELIEKGVSKSDIVLGFISEKLRIHSGYAIT